MAARKRPVPTVAPPPARQPLALPATRPRNAVAVAARRRKAGEHRADEAGSRQRARLAATLEAQATLRQRRARGG